MIWLILSGWGIALVAFLFGWIVHMRFSSDVYDGTILITKYPDGRILYSLELDEDPEIWQYKKDVLLGIAIDEQ